MKTIFKNKKKVIFSIVFMFFSVIFLGIFMQSCSNDEFGSNDDAFNTNVNFSSIVVNPYDFIGKYHNEGLQFVIEKSVNSPKLKSEREQYKQIEELVISYMKENDILASYNSKSSICSSLIIENIKDKISLNKIKLKNSNLFSVKEQQLYFNKIETLISNKNISSPQYLIDEINKVEYDVLNDNVLSDEEKVQLLITSAVAKYSSIFWIEFLLNNDNIEQPKNIVRLKNGSESNWNFLNWWQSTFIPKAEEVVKADFAGAGSGAVMGAIYGATGGTLVAPGPGTVTLAVTGAVVGGAQGAIGSSALAGVIVSFW